MGSPVQSGRSPYPPVHYVRVFPGREVLCKSKDLSTPASSDWNVVNCRACLTLGAAEGNQVAAARLAAAEPESD